MVLVDEDGQPDRLHSLQGYLSGLVSPPVRVVAVARPELEAWLIADHAAVVGSLSFAPDEPPARESLPPRRAKELLGQWAAREAASSKAEVRKVERRVRLDLARNAKFEVLVRLELFTEFLDALRQVLRDAR